MPTDVLPDILAPAVADSVRRVAAEPANGAFEARNLALLSRHCEYMLQEARAIEAEMKALVNEGVEAGLLRRRCESALSSIGQALTAAAGVLHLAIHLPPAQQSDLVVARSTENVEKVRQGLLVIRAVYLGYMEVLNRPLPPIDWKLLEEESRAAHEAGAYVRYETPEDLLRDFGGGL
jgi:hypothetical protein